MLNDFTSVHLLTKIIIIIKPILNNPNYSRCSLLLTPLLL